MKSSRPRKRPIHENPQNKKSKSKSKSKSKKKQNKFNPINYLNTLIDMQNTMTFSTKKKKMCNRQITSVLTNISPFQQNTTHSSSKFRSKSSTSNYRKKHHNTSREPMAINLHKIISDEQNIKFTQNSARSQNRQPIKYQKIPNQTASAIIIQRAWRNYQTYKMIHQHYLIAKHQELKKNLTLGKTLKISDKKPSKEEKSIEKISMNKQNKVSQEQTVRMVDERIVPEQTQTNENQFNLAKEKQIERWKEVIGIIENQTHSQKNDDLLKKLLIKFQQNKKNLEEQVDKQLQSYQLVESVISQQKSDSENLQQFREIDLEVFQSELSNKSFDESNSFQIDSQFKIFIERLRLLDEKKKNQMEKVHEELSVNQYNTEALFYKKQAILMKHNKDKKDLQRSKRQFVSGFHELKKNALKYLKQSTKQEQQGKYRLKSSISADNTVIKYVLKEIKNKQLFEKQSEENFHQIFQLKSLTPPKNTPQHSVFEEVAERSSTKKMKKYAEDIQNLIEKTLFQEFIEEAYTNNGLYVHFKPYIEEIYEFKKITDTDIKNYVSTILTQYYPPKKEVFRRLNQKINPTSSEILRIIRDPEYEIQEYELIIPEESFKKYRADVQKDYLQKRIKTETNLPHDIEPSIKDKVFERQLAKEERLGKYQNFQRDLKIMYMKSVFNCFNQFLIQAKSVHSFMNSRSSIGPGELKLAIKQYNEDYFESEMPLVFEAVKRKMSNLLEIKCKTPNFKNEREIEYFHLCIMEQIKQEYQENEFKWVNYMDQVLQIWQDLCDVIYNAILDEATYDILKFF